MFLTMKWCMILFTIASVLCTLAMTAAILYYLYRSHRYFTAQEGTPHVPFFSSLFIGRRNSSDTDNAHSKSSISSGGGVG